MVTMNIEFFTVKIKIQGPRLILEVCKKSTAKDNTFKMRQSPFIPQTSSSRTIS